MALTPCGSSDRCCGPDRCVIELAAATWTKDDLDQISEALDGYCN